MILWFKDAICKMTQSVSETIIKNTVFNAIGRFWGILVTIVLTPYILKYIGIERYGIWAIVGVLTGYFSLLDFGMGTSFVKYIAEYYAKEDYKSINQVVSTGVAFYSLFALMVIPLAFIIMNPLLSLFRIPPGLHGEAYFVFRLGVVLFVISNAISPFQALQGGLQRMDVSNKISIGVSIPMIFGTVYFLKAGYGLRGLMLNNAIILAISGTANVLAGFKILPEVRCSPALVTKEMLRKLLDFGYKLQLAKIADAIVFQTDRLLIAHFLSVGEVGLYQLGSSIAQQTRQVPLLLVSAILPAASELDAKSEHVKLKELYLKGTKYLILVSFPLIFFTMASAQLIMRLWVGPGYEKSALVIQILAAGYLVNLLSGVGTSVGAAIDKPEFQMGAAIVSAISNIILSVMLVLSVGFFGVAIATSVSLMLGPTYFFIKLHRHMSLSSGKIIMELVLLPFVAAVIPALLLCVGTSLIAPAASSSGRLVNSGVFILEGTVFLGIYLLVILRAGYLDGYDRNMLKKIAMHSGFGRLRSGRVGAGC
jgi:O-antigen/teichoic acid export membrane protein